MLFLRLIFTLLKSRKSDEFQQATDTPLFATHCIVFMKLCGEVFIFSALLKPLKSYEFQQIIRHATFCQHRGSIYWLNGEFLSSVPFSRLIFMLFSNLTSQTSNEFRFKTHMPDFITLGWCLYFCGQFHFLFPSLFFDGFSLCLQVLLSQTSDEFEFKTHVPDFITLC